MCLDSFYHDDLPEIEIGYKVFLRSNKNKNSLHTLNSNFRVTRCAGDKINIPEWAKDDSIYKGVHFFLNKKEAERFVENEPQIWKWTKLKSSESFDETLSTFDEYVVMEIAINKIVAIGNWYTYQCGVCESCKILDKPPILTKTIDRNVAILY